VQRTISVVSKVLNSSSEVLFQAATNLRFAGLRTGNVEVCLHDSRTANEAEYPLVGKTAIKISTHSLPELRLGDLLVLANHVSSTTVDGSVFW
jgi:hypothetical protein